MKSFLDSQDTAKNLEFLATCDKRDTQRRDAEAAHRKVVRDAILDRFNYHRDAYKRWDAECSVDHDNERSAFLARRRAEVEFQESRVKGAKVKAERKVAEEANTTMSLVNVFEDNLRRLGLDESQAAAVSGEAASGASGKPGQQQQKTTINKGDTALTNEARIMEIRQRKEDDLKSRREKMQRQYRMLLEQERTGQDVLRKQQEELFLQEARAEAVKLRNASLQARREMIEREVERSLSEVQIAATVRRQTEDFWEGDAAFAVVAAAQQKTTNALLTTKRSEKHQQEVVKKDGQRSDIAIYSKVIVNAIVDLSIFIADKNYMDISGAVIRDPKPTSFKEWRDALETYMSQPVLKQAYERIVYPPAPVATPRLRHKTDAKISPRPLQS